MQVKEKDFQIYFSLGSNLGDRKRNLEEAVAMLDEALGCPCAALSAFVETVPMGFSGGLFLNAAALYVLPRPDGPAERGALELLRRIKEIERSLGRTDPPEYAPDGSRIYHSRTIDIDILFYGNARIELPQLFIPHKGIAERPFVMDPLREIARPELKEAFPEYNL